MDAFGMGTAAREGIGLPRAIANIGLRRLREIDNVTNATKLCSAHKAGKSTLPGNAE